MNAWRDLQRAVKRVADVVTAAVLLIVLAPVLALIALAIRVTSGAPVFFEWNVVGEEGRAFTGYKFRTMVVGADLIKQELLHLNEMQGPVFKIKNDPRITPVGRVLRKYSLDELPQLWSVLKGDMSLVGPRPPLVSEFAEFTEEQKQKLAVRPGMTSLWQVRGKPQDFGEWLTLDLEYIARWSLWLDFEILVRTFWVVITGGNH
ncbi:MAG: sugar transferase [Chloroflexi bacterium]|nr:sugar transferase [Chloroflexota bacterium]